VEPHSYRYYLVCRRTIQALFASFGASAIGTARCLDLCHAYFTKHCGKTAVNTLLSSLQTHSEYEYILFYYLVSAWYEWNNVWAAKVTAWFAFNQRSALLDRFEGTTPHPRSEWLLYCPNCLNVQSLVVESRGTASSYPTQYD